MSTVIGEPPFRERRIAERRRYPNPVFMQAYGALRVSWGGIWGGVLAVMGLLLLLTALGLAVGVIAMDNADAGTLGTAAAIWAGASLLVALFVGGYMSTRLGMTTDKANGAYEGALVWVLSVLLILYMAASGIGLLASGAFNMVSGAGQMIGAAAGATPDLSSGSVDQMLARLRSPETAQQLAKITGQPVEQVRAQLNETAQAVERVRNDPAQAAAEVRRRLSSMMASVPTERIQQAAGTSAWGTFIALVLSLAAAIGGAMVGRRSAERQLGRTLRVQPQ